MKNIYYLGLALTILTIAGCTSTDSSKLLSEDLIGKPAAKTETTEAAKAPATQAKTVRKAKKTQTVKAAPPKSKPVAPVKRVAAKKAVADSKKIPVATKKPQTPAPTKKVAGKAIEPARFGKAEPDATKAAPKTVANTPAIAKPATPSTFVVFNGQNPSVFKVKFKDKDTLLVVPNGVQISSTNPKPTSGGRTRAVRIELGNELQDMLSGKKIRVTVKASPALSNPSSKFAVAYSTNQIGNSGWKKFDPAKNGGRFSFDYKISDKPQKPAGDYIGIWADVSAAGKSIVVWSVEVSIIE